MIFLVLVLLLCGGCFGARLEDVAHTLQERHIQSCILTVGFPWPFMFIHTITVTGGLAIYDCIELDRRLNP
jgi:hypothetical protein